MSIAKNTIKSLIAIICVTSICQLKFVIVTALSSMHWKITQGSINIESFTVYWTYVVSTRQRRYVETTLWTILFKSKF